jgi:hypothetical protein
VDLDLVDEPGRQTLVDDVGAARDEDVLPSDAASACSSGLDAIGHEVNVVSDRVSGSRLVGDDEDGRVEGGSSPHQPFQGSSGQGPARRLNMARPMMWAPTLVALPRRWGYWR